VTDLPAHANETSLLDDPRLPQVSASMLSEEIEFLRGLTERQRSEMIVSACRAAARIERSRRENGMPPSVSAPWPDSTWEFLRQHAPNARQ
jgi:hypothetical protein